MAKSLTARRASLGIGMLALGIVALAALAGCSGRTAVYPVRGQVLDRDGNPARGALVVFHPTTAAEGDQSLKAVGRVDEKGEFRLTTYVEGDGAAAGDYAVTLVWPTPRETPYDPEGPDQLGGAYARPETTTVRFTVERQENQVPTIRLR